MIRIIKIVFILLSIAMLNGSAGIAPNANSACTDFVFNSFEEDCEQDGTSIINIEYDRMGAGGNGDDAVSSIKKIAKEKSISNFLSLKSHCFFSFVPTSISQYNLLLKRTTHRTAYYILYCCSKVSLSSVS